LLHRAELGLRVHVGPVDLLLHAMERVVSDDAACAQFDQLAALRFGVIAEPGTASTAGDVCAFAGSDRSAWFAIRAMAKLRIALR